MKYNTPIYRESIHLISDARCGLALSLTAIGRWKLLSLMLLIFCHGKITADRYSLNWAIL